MSSSHHSGEGNRKSMCHDIHRFLLKLLIIAYVALFGTLGFEARLIQILAEPCGFTDIIVFIIK